MPDLIPPADRYARPPYDRLWDRLVTRTRSVMAAVRRCGFTLATGNLGWHSRTPMVREAALMARVIGDADALDYVRQCVDVVATFQPSTLRGHLLHSYADVAQAADLLRDLLGEQTLSTLKTFMRQTAIGLADGPDRALSAGRLGNNIDWALSAQTACCALLWGESAGYPDWRRVVDRGIVHTRGYLRYGCDASGHSYEGTGYGQNVLRLMFDFVELLKQTGYADLYASEPRLRLAVEAALHSLLPDRRFLTNDNDHGMIAAASMAYLLLAYRAWGDPLHLGLWYAYQGPDHPIRPFGDQWPWVDQVANLTGPTPDATSSLYLACRYWDADAPRTEVGHADRPAVHFAAGTGKANLRTSWSNHAVFVQVLGAGRSRMSQTHRHADVGHVSIFAYGDYLAVDTGRYNSDEDQHSVMLVDGKCHAPVGQGWGMDHHAGRLEDFTHEPPVTYVRADGAHVKGCYWALRHVLFVTCGPEGGADPDQAYIVTLDDVNKDNQPHHFAWQLQGHDDFEFTIAREGSAAQTGGPQAQLIGRRARLDLSFVLPSRGQAATPTVCSPALRQDVKPWQAPHGPDQQITGVLGIPGLLTSVRRPRLLAEFKAGAGRLLTVLSPRRSHEPPLPVQRWSTPTGMGVRIEFGHGTDTILAAPSHGLIDTDDVRALTELLWIRRDRTGRVTRTWSLDAGDITWK